MAGRSPDTRGASRAGPAVSGGQAPGAAALVEELVASFREQIRRSLRVELDGSETSLAFVDHHLRSLHDETREPIVGLVAAGAGAYFGEVVRETIGATWIGDGRDPRRLRLLVAPQFLHFSPVDQAFEAIAGHGLDPDDERHPVGHAIDAAFHLRPPTAVDEDTPPDDDAAWLEARLAELPPIFERDFYTLTCRYETLKLMLELLAAKQSGEGRRPRTYAVEDYLAVLTPAAQ